MGLLGEGWTSSRISRLLLPLDRTASSPWDDVGGGHLAGQEVFHVVHVGGDMAEEHLVACAEGVEAGLNPCTAMSLTGLVGVEPVLGALSVAGEKPFASEAFGGQLVAFVYAEGGLFVGMHHLSDGLVGDVAQKIVLIDKMITWVEIPVVLDDGIATAGLGEGAGARHLTDPVCKGRIEVGDETASYIVADPIIEYATEESTETDVTHRPRCNDSSVGFGVNDVRPFLLVRLARPVQWVLDMLHDRHELHEAAADLF